MLLAQFEKLSRFLEVLAERPFDQYIFAGFDGWDDGLEMAVYTHGADYEIDVLVVGKV